MTLKEYTGKGESKKGLIVWFAINLILWTSIVVLIGLFIWIK